MSVYDVASGTLVDGRYRIKSRLGSGGMADVYCATDEQLGRDVALKLLHRRFAADHEFVERFRREASSAAGLQHPNVVGVFDRGEWDGTSYIAMEHLEGRTLKQIVVEEAPLEPLRAIDLAVQVLRAARFAHKRGIVHRDLKPHNVIVDAEERAKVTDFGIARAGASDMTQTGSIMGTAQYLSPEQAQGLAVDERSDLYAIGIVLYEILTGRVPFDGETAVAIALKQVGEPPVPPSRLNPSVPPELEAVVLRALEKDPARRFQDADEMIAALEEVRAHLVDAARPPVGATAAFAPVGAAGAGFAAAGPALASEAYQAGVATGAVPDEHPPPPEEPERHRWWPWAVLAVALLLAAGGLAGYLLARPHLVTLPAVVGQPIGPAEAQLRSAGFPVRVVHRYDPRVGRGLVAAEDPAGGLRVRKSTPVTLTVSDGTGIRRVPDVTGQPRASAERRLRAAGLQVRERRAASSSVPGGLVVATSPPPGTRVRAGTTIAVTVSTGAPQVTVPSLTGLSSADAQSKLTAAGLRYVVVKRASDQDPGTVLDQSPGAGSTVDAGTTVTLTVAKAKAAQAKQAPAQVSVPGVVGRQEGDAVNALSNAGLSPVVGQRDVTDAGQDGVVLRQSPSPGKRVPTGASVTITVGRLRQPGTGPNGDGSASSSSTPGPAAPVPVP